MHDIPDFEFIDSKPPLETSILLLREELEHRRRHAEQFKDTFHLGEIVAYSICLHYLDCAYFGDGVRVSHGTLKYLNKADAEDYEVE